MTSTDEIQILAQALEPRLNTHPHPGSSSPSRSLDTLPEDVINKIIDLVACKASEETATLMEMKWRYIHRREVAHLRKPFWLYQQLDTPLNSIQALGAVNRRLYELCRPVLWKKLNFPTALPIPLRGWANILIPKHGVFVQSLSIKLSDDWLKHPHESSPLNPYENVIISSDLTTHTRVITRPEGRVQCISFATFCEIILNLPNLTTLKIVCPIYYTVLPEKASLAALQAKLICSVPRFTQLRHLSIDSQASYPMHEDSISAIIEPLCLLESLSISNIVKCPDTDLHLGKEIGKLHHLSHLYLKSVDSLDDSWHLHSGPPSLTHLEIDHCQNFRLTQAPRVLKAYATQITSLQLGFSEPWYATEVDQRDLEAFDPEKYPDQYCFELPSLTELTLWNRTDADLLRSFQNCLNLRRLIYYPTSIPDQPCSMVDLVCNITWRLLEFLQVHYPPNQAVTSEEKRKEDMNRLNEHCDQYRIKFCS